LPFVRTILLLFQQIPDLPDLLKHILSDRVAKCKQNPFHMYTPLLWEIFQFPFFQKDDPTELHNGYHQCSTIPEQFGKDRCLYRYIQLFLHFLPILPDNRVILLLRVSCLNKSLTELLCPLMFWQKEGSLYEQF